MVGIRTRFVFGAVVLCALTSAGLAQHQPKSAGQRQFEPSAQLVESDSPRLLNADGGMAIIGAALQARNTLRPYGDCSHLVHTIYEQAGFHYRYADSTDLYHGVAEFRQVTHPQPGDLAVWRGHAAIVVNPAQHTFFSATRPGLRVESYDLDYWKRRGTPRFFRYLKSTIQTSLPLTRTSSTVSSNLHDYGSRAPHSADKASDDLPGDDDPDNVSNLSSSSHLLVLHSVQPTPQQLNETLSQYFGETEKLLRSQDLLKFSQPVIVFDRIEVKNVRMKKDQAWADVKIDGLSSLATGRATSKKRSEQQRWLLTRRAANTWELIFPPNTSYLPHDVAVRILAHQLAALAEHNSEADDSSKDQAQLARILDTLLRK
jgi:hypothetical protein